MSRMALLAELRSFIITKIIPCSSVLSSRLSLPFGQLWKCVYTGEGSVRSLSRSTTWRTLALLYRLDTNASIRHAPPRENSKIADALSAAASSPSAIKGATIISWIPSLNTGRFFFNFWRATSRKLLRPESHWKSVP